MTIIFTFDISKHNGMIITGNLSDEIAQILASLQNSDNSLSSQSNQTVPSVSTKSKSPVPTSSIPLKPAILQTPPAPAKPVTLPAAPAASVKPSTPASLKK